jgi:hypothetical protein
MARGRKPKNSKVVAMEGPVSHRPERPAGPEAAPGGLVCNGDFDADAQYAWDFWTKHMSEAGMTYAIDSLTLQAACFAFSRAMRAERMLMKDPTNWRADVAASRGWKQVKDFALEFGLTLVSRNKVVTANPHMQLDLELEAALNA